jgi:hypothetical protein
MLISGLLGGVTDTVNDVGKTAGNTVGGVTVSALLLPSSLVYIILTNPLGHSRQNRRRRDRQSRRDHKGRNRYRRWSYRRKEGAEWTKSFRIVDDTLLPTFLPM